MKRAGQIPKNRQMVSVSATFHFNKEVVLTQLYNGVFRQMIFDEFEQEKQEAIDKAHAKAEKDGTEYKEPQIAKTDLEELDVSLG